jgi:hypothetical protein
MGYQSKLLNFDKAVCSDTKWDEIPFFRAFENNGQAIECKKPPHICEAFCIKIRYVVWGNQDHLAGTSIILTPNILAIIACTGQKPSITARVKPEAGKYNNQLTLLKPVR